MLEIGAKENVPAYIKKVKQGRGKLMGFWAPRVQEQLPAGPDYQKNCGRTNQLSETKMESGRYFVPEVCLMGIMSVSIWLRLPPYIFNIFTSCTMDSTLPLIVPFNHSSPR